MKQISYITVSTQVSKYEADKQSKDVIDKIGQGFKILSAVKDYEDNKK